MAIKVIYHGNCSDGFCAAYIASKKLPEAEYIPFNYAQKLELDNFNKEDVVFILDFSFKRPVMIELASKVKEILVIDHHKTAKAELVNLPENVKCIFNMDKSGAMLTWEFFHHGTEAPLLVQYVQDRDLWKWFLPHSKEISNYVNIVKHDFKQWDILNGTFVEGLHDYRNMGQAIGMKIDQQVDNAVEHAVEMSFGNGYRCLCVNSTVNFSEIAGKLAKMHPSGYGLAWFYRSDNKYQYSLRSRTDVDVSEIAKSFGGGGHKNAAGFESDVLVCKTL